MNKNLLAILLAIVILVIVLLIYYFMVYLPSKSKVTSQALTVSSVPPSSFVSSVPPSPTTPTIQGIPFYVHAGSALAQYANMTIPVIQGPIFIGDSAILILQAPTGNYIVEVMDIVSAEQIGVGTAIVSGSLITPIIV